MKQQLKTEIITNSGTDIVTEKKKTLDEILAGDKELQSQYDRKVTHALKTARLNWEKKSKKIERIKLNKLEDFNQPRIDKIIIKMS